MITVTERIRSFAKLGQFISQCLAKEKHSEQHAVAKNLLQRRLLNGIQNTVQHNKWFTPDNIRFALKHWSKCLTEKQLRTWISKYPVVLQNPKRVGLVMAGNIPLVGFHDFLCVMLAGHKVLIKLSTDDNQILPLLTEFLIETNPEFENLIGFSENQMANYDAIIATGSNNAARYFEYYFGKVPNIIRKNRNSVAVLTGNETQAELKALGNDIFRYFGLGCRSVSKIYVPSGYDFDLFFKAIFPYKNVLEHAKYGSNYDYNKAVYLMSDFQLLENGFLLLKEDKALCSPIATLFYETYQDHAALAKQLQNQSESLQCMVGNFEIDILPVIPFGATQHPKLTDYADHVDIMKFLLELDHIV